MYQDNRRGHMGHLQIPPGAQPPSVTSPTMNWAPAYGVPAPAGPSYRPDNQWQSPLTPRPRSAYYPTQRAVSTAGPIVHDSYTDQQQWSFPEPQIYRTSSSSATMSLRPEYQQHRTSRSDSGRIDNFRDRNESMESLILSDSQSFESSSPRTTLSHELSDLSLGWEDNLAKFQAGQLSEQDEEWHRLVSAEARESLPKKEVQRQSVLFEIIKAEKEYVSDMEILQDVFITPLLESNIMPRQYMEGFCKETFWNLNEILRHHQRMLGALFDRQREQHPLIQSVADIVLDTALRFRPAYESYIKHYPLSEAQHRRELRRNPQYLAFIQQCLQDPRTRKRDLITFISRPVTRLPRLSLVLDHIMKLTEPDHPDIEQLPIILEILSDFIKSTQPGIAAAESKVKYWSLIESLEYRNGETIDMDIYNDNRTLNYQGTLARRQRSETDWHGWHDLDVALLDNYLLMTRKETRKSGTKYVVASRPIPLEYLRLGSFTSPPENRKVRSHEGGGPLSALQFRFEPHYPFTIYHASSKSSRRYTLFASSERVRTEWKDALRDALGLRKAQQDANKLYVLDALNDGHFRSRSSKTTPDSKGPFLGRIICAATFKSAGKSYVTVGTSQGIHISLRGDEEMMGALRIPNPTRLAALQNFNKLVVHCDLGILSYSLDLLARVCQQTSTSLLEASMERITPRDESVQFFRAGVIADRTIIVYVSRTFMQTNIHALEVVAQDNIISNVRNSQRIGTSNEIARSFRSFGSPFYVPKDAFEITMLRKTMAISTEKGLTIVDPTHITRGQITSVPDFSGASTDPAVAALKTRCENARALGIVQSNDSELLIIYDGFGCYVTKHGAPAHKSQVIRWETPTTSYTCRGGHLLLLSPNFIEIREIATGYLLQVIDGQDFRLVQSGSAKEPTLFAMKGDIDDVDGQSDALLELVETAPLTANGADEEILWDEWD